MKTILVKAAPLVDPALVGRARVVKEHTHNRYITEHEAVEVTETAYYLRKLAAGELVRAKRESRPTARLVTVEDVIHLETEIKRRTEDLDHDD